MAAPTDAALVKKTLANSEPSTHGPLATLACDTLISGIGRTADKFELRKVDGASRKRRSGSLKFIR
jgi:hypothetical protein